MRFVLSLILTAVGVCRASNGPKSWTDWLLEGKSLREQGNYPAAAQAFEEALMGAELSAIGDKTVVKIHADLAAAYADAGQYAKSQAEYRRTMSLVEKIEGRASLNYAVTLARMAVLPTQCGNSEQVIRFLRNALSTYAQNGPVNSLTMIRDCLACILRDQKRYQEAEPLLLDALADLERVQAPDIHLLARSLNDLAVLRFNEGRYEESFNLQLRSIRVLEAAFGTDYPSLVGPLNNLATTYVKLGRLNEASVTFRRAIDICGKTLGADHLDYAILLQNYGVVLKKLGQKRQAKKVKAQGLQIEQAALRRNGVGLTMDVTGFGSEHAKR